MKPARLARLHEATNREFGVDVVIYPRAGGGYVSDGPDITRSYKTVTGYVTRVPDAVTGDGNPAASANSQARLSADTVKYRTEEYPDVREGDQVGIADRYFRVSRTAPYGTDRTVLFLTPLKIDP